jgi:signal transduction histidine kinase
MALDGAAASSFDASRTSRLLQLLPGMSAHPEPVARRRLVTGLAIVIGAVMLQSVPLALRASAIAPVLARFVWWLLEMLALTFALSWAYDRCQRRRVTTARTLLGVVALAAIVSIVSAAIYHLAVLPAWPLEGPRRTIGVSLAFGLFVGVLRTGVWAFAFVFPYVTEDSRLRALEADKLRLEAEQLKTTAELARLRSQLEPHFLLNTLNAIAGLVTENPREARRLIACLGDLLRDSVQDGHELQPLEDEIAWLRRYAEILESRHAGTLAFEWDVEPAARHVLLPRLLLQPLVENAVKHGALRRRGKGVVAIRAALDDRRRLVCTIEDNGPGLPRSEPRRGAFGLRSVRRRLELEFPDGVLRLESTDAGTRSIVELPGKSPVKEMS